MREDETTRKFRKELHSGTTSLAILALVVRAKKPVYGYEIGMRLAGMFEEGLPMNQGALYPVLRSLEKAGLLESRIEPSTTGPPRRYYWPTDGGRAALVEWQGIWAKTRNWVDLVLEPDNGRRAKNAARRSQVP